MKYFLFSFLLLIISTNIFSQNVGIGTTTPAFKLDVKGNINTDSVYHIAGNPVLSIKGLYNTFVGVNSGIANTTGTYNTSYGNSAMWLNSTGSSNTVVGANALFVNTAGDYNTAIGIYALSKNTVSFNTAVGSHSLANNTTGTGNTAFGYRALYGNSTGIDNTATGHFSLNSNTIGNYNVASGYYALNRNTTGTGNTAVGYKTLFSTPASDNNTALGHLAGVAYNLGWNNTLIGSYCDAVAPGIFNSVGLGNSVNITASNQVRIGNSSNTSIGGYAGWTNFSDGRYKKNIKEDVKGLAFIMQLRPVTYQLDITGLRKKLNESDEHLKESKMDLAIAEKESMIQTGFVAQEVEAAAKKLGYDFSGVDKPKNENDFYGLRYAEFVVPLVKAMQEQQQIINDLQKRIKVLEGQNK